MTDDVILWQKDPDDAFVTLVMNRPDKMNAMNQEMGDALEAAILRAVKDPDIRAIVLTGAGRAFTSGFDLGGEDFEMDADQWRADIGENMRRLGVIREVPIPIIAAVNGYALAGGLELMMCCDMVIVAEDAKLGEPEVRHVSAPPTLMLPWTVPMVQARYLMYTGDLIDGREAARIHLANKAVPLAELKTESERMARKCARMPGTAIKYAKAALNHMQQTAGLDSSWAYNRETTAILHGTEEGKYWMRLLKEKTLREFLETRDGPFSDLD